MVDLSTGEANDVIRSSKISLKIILSEELKESLDKDAIIEAACSFKFSDSDSSDRCCATFEVNSISYRFKMMHYCELSTDGYLEDGRVLHIGLAER